MVWYNHVAKNLDDGIPRGRSSLIYRFNNQLRTSHAIWPANMSMISTSRFDQISVT